MKIRNLFKKDITILYTFVLLGFAIALAMYITSKIISLFR
jgi:hypothetical protein